MNLRGLTLIMAGLSAHCASHPDTQSADAHTMGTQDTSDLPLDVIASETGANSDPNRVSVMHVALDEINALGGVRGRRLKLAEHDNASSEDAARTLLAQLMPNKPFVLFGTHTSNVLPLVQVAASAKVFVFGAGSTLPNIVSNATGDGAHYFARTTPSGELIAQRLAQLVYSDGATKVGVIYLNDTVSKQYKDDFLARYKALGGSVDAAALQSIPTTGTATSYAALLTGAMAGAGQVHGRKAVVVIGSAAQFKVLLGDAVTANASVQWYASHNVQSGDVLAKNGAAAEGLRGVKPAKGDLAAYDHYAQRLKAAFPNVNPDGTHYPNIYDELLLFALTAEKAGLSADLIRAGLRDVSNSRAGKTKFGPDRLADAFAAVRAGTEIDFDGASGSLELDANGDPEARFQEFHVAGGKFVAGDML